MARRVVVTGRGVVSPLGVGLANHGETLLAGRSVISSSERAAGLGLSQIYAGQIPAKQLEQFASGIPKKQRKLMNRAGVLAVVAAHLAAQEAQLSQAEIDPSRLGIFFATWFTTYEYFSFIRYLAGTESQEELHRMNAERANRNWTEQMNPLDYSLKVLPNLTAGHLAILHNAQGYCRSIADGGRGGLLAIAQGAQAIRRGEVDIVLAGGAESSLEEGIFCDLANLDTVAKAGGEGICRPFDSLRCGMVVGEGAAVLALEEREQALARGATIFGEIAGSASTSAGGQQGLRMAMEGAVSDAGLALEEVGMIHANGDSTLENDRAEWLAIKESFGARASCLPVTATKSLHGHLFSAAGAVELVSSLLMLERGVIPPIANLTDPEPDCSLDLVRGSPRAQPGIQSIVLNAIGMFGEAASVALVRGC